MATPPSLTDAEKKQLQHDSWTAFAPGYSEVAMSSFNELYDHFVTSISPRVSSDTHPTPTRILDVAAASGEPSLSLAKALPHAQIIATDLAEAFIPLGQARADAAGLTNISFQVADGEHLPYEDNSFDVVVCCLGLMFFPDERKGLSEFYRVLKPGGTLAVAVWSNHVNFFAVAGKVASEIAPPTPGAPPQITSLAMRFGDAKGLIQDIGAAGFLDIDHHQLDLTLHVPNSAEEGWFEKLWKLPFPVKTAVAKAEAEGRRDALAEAKLALVEGFRQVGMLDEATGDLRGKGNICHFILASKNE